jgi:signal peptidase I
MTFPTRGPSEDDNQLSPGTPQQTTRWETEPDAGADQRHDFFENGENGHDSGPTPDRTAEAWADSQSWIAGDELMLGGPWDDEASAAPAEPAEVRSANLGNNLLMLLSGAAFVVIGLLISAGSLELFGTQGPAIWGAVVVVGFVFVLIGIVNGVRGITSSDNPGREWKRVGRATLELAQTLVLAVLIFLAVRSMAQNFRVEGASMEPGLHNGQYLLVNKAVYFKLNLKTLDKYLPFIHPGDNPERFIFHGPQRGDVIVFEFPEDRSRDFIKRVIGIPGDTVKVDEGTVYVNGVPLTEPYVNEEHRSNMDEKVVPPGEYFVLGDNRGNSSDSRSWGFVPEENIIGRAMFTYWPDLGGVGNRDINLGFIELHLP